jgi:CheY-like chemotaxis protein
MRQPDMGKDAAILLLEDEPIILMDLSFAAEDFGVEPLCAATAEEALAILEAAKTVVTAVLDVTLPGGQTSAPVARELERRSIPYLLYSGDLNRADELVNAFNAQHIAKPASADTVIAAALGLAAAPETA